MRQKQPLKRAPERAVHIEKEMCAARFSVVVLVGKGQAENEFRALSFRTDDIDVLIVRLDDLLGDGEGRRGRPPPR